jgi:hypothetical protein
MRQAVAAGREGRYCGAGETDFGSAFPAGVEIIVKTSTSCPACDGRVTLCHVFLAPTPLHIRCRHCRTKLLVNIPGFSPFALTVILLALCVPAVILGYLFGISFVSGDTGKAYILGAAGLAYAVVLEVGIGIVLFTFGGFTSRGQKQRDDLPEESP